MLMKKTIQRHHQMSRKACILLIAVVQMIAFVTFAACADNTDGDTPPSGDDGETMYQVSTLQALLDGGYDGHITVGELKKHGDIGVGTFDKIDGEMIIVDGTVYQARYDGSVNVADDKLTVPFANITHLDEDFSVTLPKISSMDDLTAQLTEAINSPSLGEGRGGCQIYVARMEIAQCDEVFVRSELPQQKPYRPLAEVLKTDQREFTYTNIGGTIVALYFPDFFDKQNSTGWHLHFVSTDKTKGGHIFDITTSESVTVHIDATPYYNLYMP